MAVEVLLQLSITVQVLVMDNVHPVPVSGPSVNEAVSAVEQLSLTLAVPKAALISAGVGLQFTGEGSVSVITGAIVSDMVISCVTLDRLPQLSVNDQVRVMTAGQVPTGAESVPNTEPGASQLSV